MGFGDRISDRVSDRVCGGSGRVASELRKVGLGMGSVPGLGAGLGAGFGAEVAGRAGTESLYVGRFRKSAVFELLDALCWKIWKKEF